MNFLIILEHMSNPKIKYTKELEVKPEYFDLKN